jgi:hypothetical protein
MATWHDIQHIASEIAVRQLPDATEAAQHRVQAFDIGRFLELDFPLKYLISLSFCDAAMAHRGLRLSFVEAGPELPGEAFTRLINMGDVELGMAAVAARTAPLRLRGVRNLAEFLMPCDCTPW